MGDKMAVIVQEQAEISVFVNEYGSITIVQAAHPEDDPIILVNACHVDALCKALKDCKKTILSQN